MSGYGCCGAQQFKKCICAQCQQISTLMQIEFTINPPEATGKNNKKKGKGKKSQRKEKSQENENGDPGTMSIHLHIHN